MRSWSLMEQYVARGAQDETRHDVRMAAPQELGDRAAHRVADRDHRTDTQLRHERRDVVSAVGEAEAARAADSATRAPACPGR